MSRETAQEPQGDTPLTRTGMRRNVHAAQAKMEQRLPVHQGASCAYGQHRALAGSDLPSRRTCIWTAPAFRPRPLSFRECRRSILELRTLAAVGRNATLPLSGNVIVSLV